MRARRHGNEGSVVSNLVVSVRGMQWSLKSFTSDVKISRDRERNASRTILSAFDASLIIRDILRLKNLYVRLCNVFESCYLNKLSVFK